MPQLCRQLSANKISEMSYNIKLNKLFIKRSVVFVYNGLVAFMK